MLYFVCYDIVDHKRLSKIAKFLEKNGIRMQYSFFSCELSIKDFEKLKKYLVSIIDLKKDNLCFIPICESCFRKIIYIGCDENFILPNYMVL